MHRLLVIIGPSGAGKSTLARALHERGTASVWPTFTTRPVRPDEQGGTLEHVFVDPDHFAQMERDGGFVATASLPDLPHRYGLPRADGRAPLPVPTVIARAEQVPALRQLADRVDVLAVMTDRSVAADRLRERRLPSSEVIARLNAGAEEVALLRHRADHVVVNNGSVDDLVRQAETLVGLWAEPAIRRQRQRGWFEQAAITVGVLIGVGVGIYLLAAVAALVAIATGGLNFGGSNK